MKRNLLLLVALFMCFTNAMAQNEATKKLELVSDNIEIPVGKQYRMFIKEFSQAIYDYLKNNPRIAIEFETDDNTIVESGGAWFRGVSEGSTTMRLVVYESANSWGYPNYEAKLDEATFNVTVKNNVAVSIPTVNTSWGIKREEISNKIQNEYGYEKYNDTYFAMHPTISDAEKGIFDIYYTGSFEFPLVFNVFNDEGQMWAYQFLIANYERIWTLPDFADAPIVQILVNNGYILGSAESGSEPALYNPETLTLVTITAMIVQGQTFLYATFAYEENNPFEPDAINNKTRGGSRIVIDSYGTTIKVNADGIDGQQVTLYDTTGKMIGKSTVNNGKATIEANQHMTVIVKVGNNMPVKVVL